MQSIKKAISYNNFTFICTINRNDVNTSISPLIQALNVMNVGRASFAINAAIFIAAFSVMLGSHFGSNQLKSIGIIIKQQPDSV